MALGMTTDDVLLAIIPVVVYWAYSGFYELLGSMKSMEGRRLHPKGAEEARNMVTRMGVVKGVLIQQAVEIAVFLLIFAVQGDQGGAAKKPSSPLAIALQLFIAMVVMDSWFYWAHRMYHAIPFLYKHVHAKHHELLVPYAYGAIYSEPWEGLILDTIGGSISLLISGMGPKTAIFFFSFATMKNIDDHCGLWLPWNPFQALFKNNCAFHDIHHQHYGTKYNLATPFFVSWDKLLGTYMPYTIVERKEGGFEARPMKD